MDLTAKALEAVTALGTISSLGFFGLSGCGIAGFLNGRRRKSGLASLSGPEHPAVSILKPLKGMDPAMWESLCSHCDQDYPDFQLIFGVSSPDDPAVHLVQRLRAEYPQRNIQLVVADRVLGTNAKVSALVQMLPGAEHDVLLVNDSDIRVERDYLQRVVAPLTDPSVGLVTCLYRGIANRTPGSRLEALGISTDFVPGVLSARFLEDGLRFGLGSTLAFRRSELQAIGGFESLVDYLADDYELGRRISSLGKRVELSDVVVETLLPAYSVRQFLQHQMRWSRTIRDARRWGYLGVLLTFGLPWALATLFVTKEANWAWVLLAVIVAARVAVGLVSSLAVLRDRQILRDLFLLPVRDMIAPIIWALSFAGNRISWRGDLFDLKDGRLARISREAAGQ